MLRTPLLAARIARRYYRTYGRLPNLLSPQSYSEKFQHLKLFDRRPYLSETSDKFAMRAYAARILGIDCYQVANRICLGEMTHAPGTGLSPLYPAIWDDRWGAMWEMRVR
jgi:hypothetical protein